MLQTVPHIHPFPQFRRLLASLFSCTPAATGEGITQVSSAPDIYQCAVTPTPIQCSDLPPASGPSFGASRRARRRCRWRAPFGWRRDWPWSRGRAAPWRWRPLLV